MPIDVEAAQKWLAARENEMLADFRQLLQIPSIESEAAENAPYGIECRRALDMMFDWCRSRGMAVKDLEGHAMWAQFGAGEKMVMTLGHLDVVPVGPGWKHDPFGAEIEDGYVYARGASDDKGPTMAASYALWAIQQTHSDLPCRVRLVYGCDEESGFGCVNRYVETEEPPTYGVAPDGGWPLIHAEKGICNLMVRRQLIVGSMELVDIRGGQRPNIVIDDCTAVVRVSDSVRDHIEAAVADSWDRNLTFSWSGDLLTLHAIGKAAHGSTPIHGDNAAVRCFRFLKEAAPLDVLLAYEKLFESMHIGGNGLGISGTDEPSGPLTANLGVIGVSDGQVEMTVNVRYPVTFTSSVLMNKAVAKLAKYGPEWSVELTDDSAPLYFPLDHPLVKTICAAHRYETGEDLAPGVMGGGTYARALPNSVAIGTGWLGDGPAHETDERLKIEHLNKMARIYVRVFAGLIDLTESA